MKYWPLLILGAVAIQSCASADRAIQVEPSRMAHEEAQALFTAGKYEESIETLDRAIELNPRNASAYVLRGKARLRQIDQGDGSQYLKETNKAFKDFNTAIQIYPLDFEAYYHRALAFASVARYRDAVFDLLNHCLKLRPNDALTNMLLGKVYDEGFVGQQILALKYYKAYLGIVGSQADPGIRARVQEIEGGLPTSSGPGEREKEAAQMFEAAMDLVAKKKRAEALKLLTEMSVKYGDTQFAKQKEKLLPVLIKSLQSEAEDGKD
jgi:tetratricopeptide (TPR) repeat protein